MTKLYRKLISLAHLKVLNLRKKWRCLVFRLSLSDVTKNPIGESKSNIWKLVFDRDTEATGYLMD